MRKRRSVRMFLAGLACGLAAAVCLAALLQGNLQVKVLVVIGAGSLLFFGCHLGAMLADGR